MSADRELLELAAKARLGSVLPAEAGLPATWIGADPTLLRIFADLVRADERAIEREACAETARQYGAERGEAITGKGQMMASRRHGEVYASTEIERRIRARGQA